MRHCLSSHESCLGDLKENSHKNRICVLRNVNSMLETLHWGIGPNEKIKGKCALYLLHTWIQWKEINTKPPYELRLGWVLDKHWTLYRQLYNDRDLGHQVLTSLYLKRVPYITSSETSFPNLCDKGFMHIHETTGEYGESITLSRPPHVPGPVRFQAVYISVHLVL